ncbi:YdhK family protein [Lentibacillus jeotgali]|uniref:YdhK family protein n=1 Tax=Lentibacillus jeotgali TaxID=558169 RepID=UPI0002626FAB|nr:YdhK family protein [Lentibacillus jeotgali]
MKKKKITLGLLALITTLVLAACGENEEATPNDDANTGNESQEQMDMNEGESDSMEGMDHSGINHSSSGKVSAGLQEAENSTYPVGSEAMINAQHMGGMDGATATITGAFDTTAYEVSYTPTNGGEPVNNHKWIIHEELLVEKPGDAPIETGTEVTLNADHMDSMNGATATIDSAEQTTVYMVSYTDTETGKEVTNHKWVIESELSPVK